MENSDFLLNLKEGERAAYYELDKSYRNVIIRLAKKHFRVSEDAEDVAQNVLIKVFQCIRSFNGDCNISTWVKKITTTECLDERDRRNAAKRISDTVQFDETMDTASCCDMPDQALNCREIVREILKEAEKLPPNQKEILIMSVLEGLSNAEIAEKTGLSKDVVKTRLLRGKSQLREKLKNIF